MAVLFQLLNDLSKCRIAVKTSGKKEGGFNPKPLKRSDDVIAALDVFVTDKYNGQLLFCTVTADDSAV